MAGEGKKRIVKDYDALPDDIVNRVKMHYPTGFAENLVYYTNKDGKKVSALPFETEDIYYLIRMSYVEAERIIEEDDDYDDDGNLKEDFAESFGGDSSGDSDSDDEDEKPRKSREDYEDPDYDDDPADDADDEDDEDDDM